MPREFQNDETLSHKQLNRQSTSLVIPQLTRVRIQNSMYYKINLDPCAQRGLNMKQLSKTLVQNLGTVRSGVRNFRLACGGVEFKCLLMKLVQLRPTWSEIVLLLKRGHPEKSKFDNKYLVVLLLVYLRVQYFYLTWNDNEERRAINTLADLDSQGDVTAEKLVNVFRFFIRDYRKIKSLPLDQDFWSNSFDKQAVVLHVDEILDWLCTEESIWGLPLGKCRWCDIFADYSSSESSSEESDEDPEVSG
ncbi:LAMI_0H08108g1_1 [Lachancea mirantina]|uniref:Pre-mRNA-splicing factor 38 n=1 Tax=Lachancea mirantina TaxID=1230905 RepID=A0A1G4KFU1_9SACH|nr:LAMI_0H08108g1_1 [Lachancea mirantina]